jgi:chemotaxis protein methyltransferase CheR
VIVRSQDASQQFRDWIARRLGLHFDDTKLEFLADVMQRRSEKTGLGPSAYLDRLEDSQSDAELHALVLDLTVPETYFFRHLDQFLAFADIALPRALAARRQSRRVKVLSAGCASGEEPYSLAMLAQERSAGGDVEILGFDINSAMLAKAGSGIYSTWALRETPADSRRRWFRGVGRDYELDRSIRSAVQFQQVNLAQERAELWAPQSYDVIFCRNVLMYFTAEGAQSLVARMTRALHPGGHLFLGHAETLRGLSNEYHLCHSHGTFYYQRKTASSEERSADPPADPKEESDRLALSSSPRPLENSVADPAWSTTWLETIRHASNRIQALSERPAFPPASRGGPAPAARAAPELTLALELLKQERFTDALELIARLPAGAENDADVLLLRAALLTHSGNLPAAERASAQLLERDELCAGAHYLLALCRESAADRQGAIDHDHTATYLDSSFAMPRLHLGLMARRSGDLAGARPQLRQALTLLKREDASRVLLFGGGFGREVLIDLCLAELKAAGGAP